MSWDPSAREGGEGVWGSGAAHLYVFYVSWRLWEAHLYVFYVSGRLRGGPTSNQPKAPGGSAKETLTRAGGGEGGRGSSEII